MNLYALSPISDGGFIALGKIDTSGFNPTTGYVVKCNAEGSIQWSKKVNCTAYLEDVIQTANGGYALVGYDFIMLDAKGNACAQCGVEDYGVATDAGELTPYTMYPIAVTSFDDDKFIP